MSLTFEDKVKLLDGKDTWHTKAFDHLDNLLMTDGPHGIRKQINSAENLGVDGSVQATCYPTASLSACSFDRTILKKLGENIAKEAIHHGVQMVLGPGMNIKRTPLCGRNFEYFSEDPYLSGELSAAFVKGVQQLGVGTSVKHFIANNQEKYRYTIDSIVDERALQEIYYKGFERAIKEKPASVMTSYNKLNGLYVSEHPILKDIIRNKWGYQGVLVSDWGAINDRIKSVKMTLDLEMPSSHGYWSKKLLEESQKDGVLKQEILSSASRIEKLVDTYKKQEIVEVDFNKQNEQARFIARESMVLVKNNEILPILEKENVVFISGFYDDIRYQGGGSSHVNSTEVAQIIDIAASYSKNIKCAKGFSIENQRADLKLEKEALELANQAKKVVYAVGVPENLETEGFDRTTLDLPINQIELFNKIYQVNQNIVLVVMSGSVVNLAPFEKAKGCLIAYLGGQASALALMDILYGRISPSGRLAETWIDDANMCNISITNDNNAVYYDESIFVGYRYYETFRKPVRYHFGHGLSYTTFSYKDFMVEEVDGKYNISVAVRNTGKMVAKEVILIFIRNNESSVYKAKRELKAFDKIELKPNEIKTVNFTLTKDDFSFYDIFQKRFVTENGDYQIELAKHSGRIIDQIEINIKGKEIKHPLVSYNQYEYNPTDFYKIYQKELPEKHIKKKRPFTLSSTVRDIEHTFMGKIVKFSILKTAAKQTRKIKDEWMKEVVKKSLMESPIRIISLYSNQTLTLDQAEGIVDILNLKIFKGIKKLRAKNKGE